MMRVYVAGRIRVESPAAAIDESALPSRQARLLFAYLTLRRAHPVSRDELASALWPESPPPSWDNALSAGLSKLRAALGVAGIEISTGGGAHQLMLPADSWIDVEAAASAIDEAEGYIRRGEAARAWGPASVAVSIAGRPLLAGEDAPWIDRERAVMRSALVRGLDCLSEVSRQNAEHALAVRFAEQAVELEPYRESLYRRLMRAHVSAGDRAEALRVFERLRRLVADELGVDPSRETHELYIEVLQQA